MKNFIKKNDMLIFIFIIFVLLFFFRPIIVQGYSMSPALGNGDMLWCNTLNRNYEINDIVVINSDSFLDKKQIIKRIAAINENQVYVLGDNREESLDSREFGWIDKKLILGVIIQ